MAAERATGGRLPREERVRRILDTTQRLVYPRGVHEVGMDELVREIGLGKATVYRLFPTKDLLVAAYLRRMADHILADIDARAAAGDPVQTLGEVLDAIEADVRRDGFRGCAFNNASIEFQDPQHPARVEARRYREELARRLVELSTAASSIGGAEIGRQVAVLIDGVYTNAAHLGSDGPATAGLSLARRLVADLAAGR